MKVMSCSLVVLISTFVFALQPTKGFNAIFDENYFPTNPDNTFGAFTFGSFATGFTDGASSFLIDVSDFGGAGVDYVIDDGTGTGTFIPQDFDPTNHVVEISVKKLSGNVAGVINVILSDDDGGGSADDHQYNFDLNSIPDDGQFHLITKSVFDAGFIGNSFGFTAGDSMFNPGLRQIQIQSAFGSTDRLNVEVDFARIRLIPEPASLGLTVFGLLATCMSRRIKKVS